MISRQPRLRRQRKIFKQQAKNFPRANQMNINIAAWGRLLKRSSPSIQNSPLVPVQQHSRSHSHSDSSTGLSIFIYSFIYLMKLFYFHKVNVRFL